MFIFDPDYTFEWPVKVRYPDAGGETIQEFTAIFEMPADEMEIYARGEDSSISGVIASVRDRLKKYWRGWPEGAVEVKGKGALPNTAENRAWLIRQRPVREAIDRALSEAVLGMREKN